MRWCFLPLALTSTVAFDSSYLPRCRFFRWKCLTFQQLLRLNNCTASWMHTCILLNDARYVYNVFDTRMYKHRHTYTYVYSIFRSLSLYIYDIRRYNIHDIYIYKSYTLLYKSVGEISRLQFRSLCWGGVCQKIIYSVPFENSLEYTTTCQSMYYIQNSRQTCDSLCLHERHMEV